MLPIFALAASAYFATNADNFVLLAAMLAHDSVRKRQIILGFGISVFFALGASYLIALAADLIPIVYLGLLGAIPLAIGTKDLFDLFRKGSRLGITGEVTAPAGRSVTYTSALTLVSNSADTIVVLSALLADSDTASEPVIMLGCVGAAVVVAVSAAYAVGHPRLDRGIRKVAPTLTPMILLFVGLYILANTATDLLPG